VPGLAHQRCFNHASREAVARCPQCRRTFCRECITEHDDRVVCAACLSSLVGPGGPQRRGSPRLARFAQSAVAVLLIWLFFYSMGRALIAMPTRFHEGTLWEQIAGEDE
jgi:hypothetical protein